MGDDPAARTASEGFNLDNTTPRGETPTDGKQASPVVLQKLSPLRPTYSFPGSVANSDLYPKFRFITEDMMNEMMKEAKRASKGMHTRKDAIDMMLGRDLTRAQFDKCVKQIKWFWFEIEDYLREIETVYNEVRIHCQTFEARRKDAEEDAKRMRRVAEFNARSGRITYDLQQQIKEVFAYIDNTENKLNRPTMKKLHGIHRGVVTSLQNLLTRLPDYELDRGLPPAYHQLAMLIRRMAQCCYKLIFGRDIHIIRNLENIRQKVEEAIGQDTREVPLYQMTPDSKHVGTSGPLWSPNKPKAKTCPVVWQEYDAHMKGKRPPRDVPHKIMHMIDISKNQGFMAPIHLQSGIEKYLRIKVPQHNKAVKSLKASTSGKLNIPLNTEKLMSALGPGGNLTDDQFVDIAQKLKKLQHDFVSEVEDEIQARLKPLLQEAKMVASAHAKKKIVNLAQMKVPLEGISSKKKIPFEFWQDTSTSKSSDLTAKQKAKMNEVIGYVNRPDSELTCNKSAVQGSPSTSKLTEAQAAPKRRGRSRSPVTIRRQNSSRSQLMLSPHSEHNLPFEGTITKPKSADRRSANKNRIGLKSKEGKKLISSQTASSTLSKSIDNPNLYSDNFPSLQLNETNQMIDSDESQVRKDSDNSDALEEPRRLERRESEHHVGSAGDHLCKLQKSSENSKSSSQSESSPTKSQQSRNKSSPGSARLMTNIKRPKETMVYMVHDVSRPSSGTGTPRGDDSSTRQRSRGSNVNRQGSAGNDEVQWAMQGSLTLWAQGQLNEMLGKLQDMEDEECAIRNRWKDHLIVDPGTSGNYRIAYGECPDFAEDKEPDAIVLMKPTDKDTVVVVSALPPSEESKEDVAGPRSAVSRGVGSKLVTDRSNQGLASPSLSGGDRVRAGRDPKDQQQLDDFTIMLESIRAYREEFDKYLRRTSHYAVGNFNPWKVIEDVSDDILTDLFKEIAVEIADIPDTCVKELYDAEFAQA